MSFITKDFISIVGSMVNQMRATQKKINDFRTGAVARTVVEATAIELDEVYQQMLNGFVDAIPVVLYLAFGFDLLPPSTANGICLITLPATSLTDTLIVAGTTITTTDGTKVYTTLADLTIPAGQLTGSVDVQATSAGSAENCGPGDLDVLVNGPAGATVTNPAAINNGTDQETDDQRKLRFQAFIQALSRGTLASLEYGATTVALTDANGVVTERVTQASAVETYLINPTEPLGRVKLYIYNGGSGASADLIAKCQQVINGFIDDMSNLIEGFKGAGIVVTVIGATLQTYNATYRVAATNGVLNSTQQASLLAEITQVVNVNGIGKTLYAGVQSAALQNVAGVVAATPLSPANDFPIGAGVVLVPGTFVFQPATP